MEHWGGRVGRNLSSADPRTLVHRSVGEQPLSLWLEKQARVTVQVLLWKCHEKPVLERRRDALSAIAPLPTSPKRRVHISSAP
eukprot:6364259-Alexandrium_andersonii.AAC.1